MLWTPILPMRFGMHHLTLAAVMAALSGPAALTAAEYKISDWMPLAVGNSWSCHHYVNDYFGRLTGNQFDEETAWPAWANADGVFTLTVERTEEIGGETYYVLSDIPSGSWPPVPPGFIGGKKLRWKGRKLMEHTGTDEQALLDLGDGPEVFEYEPTPGWEVPRGGPQSVAPDLEEWLGSLVGIDPDDVHSGRRTVEYVAGYGFAFCEERVGLADVEAAFHNRILAYEAALIESAEGTGGPRGSSGESKVVRTVKYVDAYRGERGTTTPISSSVSQSSWGQVKGVRPMTTPRGFLPTPTGTERE